MEVDDGNRAVERGIRRTCWRAERRIGSGYKRKNSSINVVKKSELSEQMHCSRRFSEKRIESRKDLE
jgi:hypothetical protein